MDGLTIVVSPLIALMKDQVDQLREVGVAAAYLNSSLPLSEYNAIRGQVARREMKLLYLAPETLVKPDIGYLLQRVPIAAFVVDEAHCISQWGHDFRPEYRQILEVRRLFPHAVTMALTATATPRVQQDIKQTLGFQTRNAFIASFNRENLFLAVAPKRNPLQQTLDFLAEHQGQSGIIYCF
ncbi:MAG: DEAD/DEAH box helicase, partial [Planctomycetes bacterium]|nr:DEAD/DEAH box helicase [Planctomycetota bacterium]